MLTLSVVFAGTVCDFRLSYGRVLSRRSQIIAVNRDKTQLLKNSDMFWKPSVAVQGTLSILYRRYRADCVLGVSLQRYVWKLLSRTIKCKYLSVSGDAGSFLVRLSKGLKGHRCPEEWPRSLKAGDVTKENANRYSEQNRCRPRVRVLERSLASPEVSMLTTLLQ